MTQPHTAAFTKAAQKFEGLARIADVISGDADDPSGMEYRHAAQLLREWSEIPVDGRWTVSDPEDELDLGGPVQVEPFDLGICAYQLRKTHIGHAVRPDPMETDYRSRDWEGGILRSFRTPRGSDDITLTVEATNGTLNTVVIPKVSLMIVEGVTEG